MLHPLLSSFKGLSVLLVDRRQKKKSYRKFVTKFRLQRPVVAYDVIATVELYLGVYYLWSSTILYLLHRTSIFASKKQIIESVSKQRDKFIKPN
jgi:hypothetical protein